MLCKKTIGGVLEEVAVRFPDRDALVECEHRICYRQLNEKTDLIAKGLLSIGISKGSYVGILSVDSIEALLLMYGIWKIGGIAMPLSTCYTAGEMMRAADDGELQYMYVENSRYKEVSEWFYNSKVIVANLGELDRLCQCGKNIDDETLQKAKKRVSCDDADTILFTSGTTGTSKPALTTHYSRVNTMILQAEALDADENDRFCSALPIFHCFALTANILAAMSVGACLCIVNNHHTDTILGTIQRERCTVLTAVPTLFSALLRKLETAQYDISSLRTGMIGGSTYSPEFFCKICEVFDFILLPSLGQTEATAGITSGKLDDTLMMRAKTIGQLFPHVEGCIRDKKTNLKLHDGEVGEICIRGFNVMQGYYKQPQATAQVIDNEGWLHTGDLGKIEDGYLYYCGRIKDLIIRGGENISPREIEEILIANDHILDAKVVGVPDCHYIEEICACVVTDGTINEDEIRSCVAERATYLKVPRYVMIMDSFPTTATGKVDARTIKVLAAEYAAGEKQ